MRNPYTSIVAIYVLFMLVFLANGTGMISYAYKATTPIPPAAFIWLAGAVGCAIMGYWFSKQR